jgi:tRNA(Arg) A34 adenosine deaminase TadA
MTDEKWLDLALKEADEAYRRGEWPVAAVAVGDDRAIATARTAHPRAQARRLVRTAEYLRWVFVCSTGSERRAM